MTAMGAVDYWCNAFGPERLDKWSRAISSQGVQVKFRTQPDDGFCSPDEMIPRMDALGVDTLMVPTADPHDNTNPNDFSRVAAWTPEEAADLCTRYPGRFVAT